MTNPAKLGRNDPCWCGSGKKLKKCHRSQGPSSAAPAPSGTAAPAAERVPPAADVKAEYTQAQKIETAKALKAVQYVASPEDYGRIREILAPEKMRAAVDRAIDGLTEEDHFALLTRLMGTATHLVRIEQRPLIEEGGYIPPDFMARFQPGFRARNLSASSSSGFRCFVEVKTTDEPAFKIGGKDLRRRRAFADTFGLPLVFVVRLMKFGKHALWLMAVDEARDKTSLVIDAPCMTNGVRSVLWDDVTYMLQGGTHFVSVFSPEDSPEGDRARHPEHGYLKEFRIVTPDGWHGTTGFDAVRYSLFFYSFDLVESEPTKEGSDTLQRLTPRLSMATCTLADLLYNMNRMIGLEPTRVLAGLEQVPVGRSAVEALAEPMLRGGVLFLMGMGSEENAFKVWQRFGGSAPAPGATEAANQDAGPAHGHDTPTAP